ncbi:MAG TPA: LCP family protein [Acidimicrobiia bacterium]|nr:LCP family protein [Acidimicrobiia bacterium]
MFRRPAPLLLALSLVIAGCSPDEATDTTQTTAEATTTTSSTTTTLPPTTTTTTVPLAVTDAPPELTAVVDGFYKYATGEVTTPPAAPEPVLTGVTPTPGVAYPKTGAASVATFLGQQVAVVETGDDLFLAVEDGSGWRIVGGQWPSLSVPAYFGAGPRFVAVVGSDARRGQTIDQQRADSIHFVGLDGAGGGGVIGVPRDSYVPVAGVGRRKINSSLATGGPDTMFQTFSDLTGLPLEGYVLTGFTGFQSLITLVLGGVDVNVPFPINDRWAKASLEAGQQILDGDQALGFARARKTTGGDLVRSEHQGLLIIGAAKAVRAMGYSAIPRLMAGAEPYIQTSLTPEQVLTFSAMAISSDLDAMPNVVTPGRSGSAGGASVVFLDDSVPGLFADFADGTLETG